MSRWAAVSGRMQNTRILVRVVMLLGVMVSAALVVGGIMSSRLSARAMLSSLETRARAHASTAAQVLAAPLFMEDDGEIASMVAGLASADQAIESIQVDPTGGKAPWLAEEPWAELAAALTEEQDPEESRIAIHRGTGRISALVGITFEEMEVGLAGVSLSTAEVAALQGDVGRTLMLSGALLLGISLLIAALFIRFSVERPLRRTVAVIEAMAHGDLTRRLNATARDEIGTMGRALDKALDQVAHAMGSIASSGTSLNAASDKLRGVSESLCAEAASSSHKAQEVSGSVAEIADNADQAALVAKDAAQLTEGMSTTFEKLKENSRQIGSVVDVINSIAMQTNLLALNASVEAARAGSAGAGFAVVADEVNALSKRTSEATDSISGMVDEIQGGIVLASDSVAEVEMVIAHINEIQAAIAGTIGRRDDTGGQGVAASVVEVTASAQEVNDSARVTLDSSADLARMAEGLSELISIFKT